MVIVFYHSFAGKEEEKIKKILSASVENSETYKLLNIVNFNPEKVLEEEKIKNIISFGKLAKKSLRNSRIDSLLEFPTAEEVSRFTKEKKLKIVEDINSFFQKDKELQGFSNLEELSSGNTKINTEELSRVGRERILREISEKNKDKKYVAYLSDKKTIIEISEKKEISGSIHMTIEDLFALLVIKDVLGATTVEIKKGE